jgi:hypothetical protein
MSGTAKTGALADVSRLTQALVRNRTWDVLNETVVARVSVHFAKAFGVRLTKQGLGKVVPAVGIAVGGTVNWTTLESIFDAADTAYRRRFLLEKYPQLGDDGSIPPLLDDGPTVPEEADEPISVLDRLTEAGGPDLE